MLEVVLLHELIQGATSLFPLSNKHCRRRDKHQGKKEGLGTLIFNPHSPGRTQPHHLPLTEQLGDVDKALHKQHSSMKAIGWSGTATPASLILCLSFSICPDDPSIQRVIEVLCCHTLAPGAPALSFFYGVRDHI